MREIPSDLLPFFFYFEGIDQRTSFKRNALVVARLRSYVHRQMQTNKGWSLPLLLKTMKRTRLSRFFSTISYANPGTLGPGWNPQQQGKTHRALSRENNLYILGKWIGCI